MPLYFGQDKVGSLYLGSTKIGAAYMGNVKVYQGMAPNTIKFKFSDSSYDPSSLTTLTGATWTQESSSPNVWVWDGSNVVDTDWSASFNALWTDYGTNNVEIIDAGALTIPTAVGYSVGSTSRGMFKGNTALVSVACTLNVPNAVNCSRIFNICRNLIGSVSIKCPVATDLTDCFGGSNSSSATKVTAINITSSSSLHKTKQMCRNCSQLTSFSISDMSGVTDTTSMFNGCASLQSLSLPSLNALTTVSSMFSGCTSLASVILPRTSSLTSTSSLFSTLTALTSVTMSDTSSVTNMTSMFYGCTSLTSIPQLDTSSVTNMSYMFNGCTSLTYITQLNTSSVSNVSKMFNGCTNVASGALALYNQMSTQTNPPTTKSNCFYNCGSGTVSGLADLEQIPYSYGGKLLDMSVVSSSWVKSPSSGASYGWYGWTSTDDNMKFQLWSEIPSYGDFITLNSMTVYTSASLSQYAGISMRRSAIGESYGTFNSALGNALNFYLAIYQVLDNSYLSIAALSPLYGSLGANEDEIDMPGTVASMTMTKPFGEAVRCDHTLGWRLGFIVFNGLQNTSNFGILYNYYFNNNPSLYCTAVNPTSAFRY